jgi:nitrate reductase gamma subunit
MEASMYDFLTGPMFWLSLGVCLIGMLVRFILYFKGLNWQMDRVAYKAYPMLGLKGALKSIIKWLIPFGTFGWRKQPFMTVIFFGFHIGAVSVPLFLLAHNLFLQEKIGFSLMTLNPLLADLLSWAVLLSALFLALRRIALPEVRILTTSYDYLILFISVAPFITGLLARYEVGNYAFWLTLHILCGEVLLLAIPFTKLSHIALFFASRAQLGMDYAIKRGGMKGKGMAW